MIGFWRHAAGVAAVFALLQTASAQEAPSIAPSLAPTIAPGEPYADRSAMAQPVAPAGPVLSETPFFETAVASKALPPVAERAPSEPAIVALDGEGQTIGQQGGTLHTLGASAKDTRLLVIYGYARLVRYDRDFNIVPDIAKSFEVEEGRRFTFRLREGHKWSDGAPFTAEDFRYYWEDCADNKTMSKFGPPEQLLVDGEKPVVEFPDALTIRYTWSKPNPYFLPALAAAQPLEIFRPAHYLKQFHARYADPETLEKLVAEADQRNWVALHYKKDRSYRNDNIDLPTLQPWVLKTEPPSDRYVFERNPYYYRVDAEGRQLPYIDQVVLSIAGGSLIPAKTGSGESDLQGAYLAFSNYTFLKQAEERSGYELRRWMPAKGARIALFPNLNHKDKVWRDLFREVDFRRALSVAINRDDINNAIFYGMAKAGNNTILDRSPLFREEYRTKWAQYDPDLANELLDGLGLTKRGSGGIRLLPNGERLQIVVETAGEDSEQTDVLELVRDDWRKIGVALFIKPSQREVFYNRVKAGSTQMAVWAGMENALPSAALSPSELAPLTGEQYQWPSWGLWVETRGQAGEKPDLDSVMKMMEMKAEWDAAPDDAGRRAVWHKMLSMWANQVYTIGIVSGVDELVVVNKRLRNVPESAVWNFNPGAFFGVYKPDTFWFEGGRDDVSAMKAPS